VGDEFSFTVHDMSLPRPSPTAPNFLRAWVLLRLRTRPSHGYELLDDLRPHGLAAAGGGPKLYRLLLALERDGLLRSTWEGGDEGPERRTYRVTRKGSAQLRRDADALSEVNRSLRIFQRDYNRLRRS